MRFQKFARFTEAAVERGVLSLIRPSDTLKVLLTNELPPRDAATRADLAELPALNGYPDGGEAIDIVESAFSRDDLMYRLVLGKDVVFTARGGPLGPFRVVTLYNATPPFPAVDLIAWWARDKPITLEDEEGVSDSFTVSFDAIAGVLTLA